MFRHLFAAGFITLACSMGAHAATYSVDGDVVGKVTNYTIQRGDTYYTIARAHDIGVVSILVANPDVDPAKAGPGTDLVLPTQHILPDLPHKGIVVNLAELRLYYYPSPDKVVTFPIGTGKDGWETQTGITYIVRKRKDPVWIVPPSIQAEDPTLPPSIGPGPDDPLGAYALSLGWPNYVIHGTNVPNSIGTRGSHGCVRLFPEDIEKLFGMVDVKTPVTVIDKFYTLGWEDNILYLQVYPTQTQTTSIAQLEKPTSANIADLYAAVKWKASTGLGIDWDAVNKAMVSHNGIPVKIASKNRSLGDKIKALTDEVTGDDSMPAVAPAKTATVAPKSPAHKRAKVKTAVATKTLDTKPAASATPTPQPVPAETPTEENRYNE